MSTKIYVGNLPWRTTDQQLNDLFSAHGDVLSVRIISDRDTGRSRGFAFVTMTTADGAQSAISALNGSLLEGRTLVVNEANNQGSRPGAGRAPVSVRTARERCAPQKKAPSGALFSIRLPGPTVGMAVVVDMAAGAVCGCMSRSCTVCHAG